MTGWDCGVHLSIYLCLRVCVCRATTEMANWLHQEPQSIQMDFLPWVQVWHWVTHAQSNSRCYSHMSICEIKRSQVGDSVILWMGDKGAKDVWWLQKKKGKIYATSYILVLDLNVYREKKNPTSMSLIILWLLDLIILWLLEGVKLETFQWKSQYPLAMD